MALYTKNMTSIKQNKSMSITKNDCNIEHSINCKTKEDELVQATITTPDHTHGNLCS